MFNAALTGLELQALGNSFLISLGVSILSVSISLVLGLLLSFSAIRAKRIFIFLLLIPLLVPPYLHAFSWMHTVMLLGDYGLLGPYSCCGVEILSSMPGVIILLTISYFPLPLYIMYQAFQNIPRGMTDAAAVTAKPMSVVSRIIVPSVLPSLLTSLLLTFILTFITFDVPALLGKKVFITQIFSLFNFTNDIPRALYLSGIPVVITGIIWSIIFYAIRNKPFFSLHQAHRANKEKELLQKKRYQIAFYVLSAVFLLTAIAPLFILQIKNIVYETTPFYTASSQTVITNTLWISFVASIVIVIFSFLIYSTLYRRFLGRTVFLSLLIVPSITFGILFIYLFNKPELNFIYATPVILILAYCLRFAPIVCELLYAHSRQINPQLTEAARMVSPPSFRMLSKIILPLYKPAIFLAWIVSFWLVATELPITLLVQPPGFQTIITRLFIVLHYGAEELMSLLTLLLLLISILPMIAVYVFLKIDKHYD